MAGFEAALRKVPGGLITCSGSPSTEEALLRAVEYIHHLEGLFHASRLRHRRKLKHNSSEEALLWNEEYIGILERELNETRRSWLRAESARMGAEIQKAKLAKAMADATQHLR